MKRFTLLAFAAAMLLFSGRIAHATDAVGAQAVSACATPNNTPKAGYSYAITMNLLAQLCTTNSIAGLTFTGNYLNVLDQNSAAILAGVTGSIPAGANTIGAVLPYTATTNWLYGTVTITASTAATNITGFGAQGAGVKIYIVSAQCARTDAGTTPLTLTFNDGATSTLVLVDAGNGGASNVSYNLPLAVAANTQATLASDTSVSSVKCSFQGYKGP